MKETGAKMAKKRKFKAQISVSSFILSPIVEAESKEEAAALLRSGRFDDVAKSFFADLREELLEIWVSEEEVEAV
jgi:hypothetical protein